MDKAKVLDYAPREPRLHWTIVILRLVASLVLGVMGLVGLVFSGWALVMHQDAAVSVHSTLHGWKQACAVAAGHLFMAILMLLVARWAWPWRRSKRRRMGPVGSVDFVGVDAVSESECHQIRRIVLIVEDVLGPPHKSVVITRVDGSERVLECRAKAEAFLRGLKAVAPELTSIIEAALDEEVDPKHANWERTLYVAD